MKAAKKALWLLLQLLLLFGVSTGVACLIFGIIGSYWQFTMHDFKFIGLYALPISALSMLALPIKVKYPIVISMVCAVILTVIFIIPLAIGAAC